MKLFSPTAAIASAGIILTALLSPTEKFVYPESPLAPSKRRAPGPKVTNGTVFESGSMTLKKGETLVLPDNAVVEPYDGPTVRFFLTKSQRCMGQTPVPMHYERSRRHFGIARKLDEGAVTVATYGEWSNRGGAARIKLLVLVPQNVIHKLEKGLSGKTSKAGSKFSPGDKALRACYWYAGPRPTDGWQPIETALHYNKFLSPR